MKKLTKESIKKFALSQGLDLFGVANIERFKDAPKRMHPASIFPEARSVIV
ncbi:MAG: epoxyqueuosine reductase, partial [bacterium (Candidatus Ratteibacteria) CG01_land_8_20_14_3_00_40_19]